MTQLTRRDLLGLAAKGAASVVVSQSLLACAAGSSGGTDTALLASNVAATPAASSAACVLTAALTEGPFFVDEKLNRADIRTDPGTGAVAAGVPLALTFNVSRVANNACTPLTGAYLDVWHCDATGIYSDVDGSSQKFLRGYQVTDANGVARFTTIYPGWYRGRAVHIHFKLRPTPERPEPTNSPRNSFSTIRFPTRCTHRVPTSRRAPAPPVTATTESSGDCRRPTGWV